METVGFSSPSLFGCAEELSGEEELTLLPRHTKVVVTGNNRTKSVLVGLRGVVKKAVGLGGWHWLLLTTGEEVKLQRNALSVIEHPTGEEDHKENECENMISSGSELASDDFQNSYKSKVHHHKLVGSVTKEAMRNHSSHPGIGGLQSTESKSSSNGILQLDELQVIAGFVQAAKRLKTVYS